ncbi:unnamed protein product, partial [Ectocarpus sp. 12 AP-2014]
MLNSQEYGITAQNVEFDIKKIIEKSRSISSKLVDGIGGLLKKNKVTVIEGEAKFENSKQLIINGKTQIKANNIIIATGARARVLEGFEPNGKNVWTYKEALVPKSTPKSMLIVGSGAIGIEFASFYNALGADVTVLEAADRILPVEDEEISKMARKSFESKGIKFKVGAKLVSQKATNSGVTIEFEYSGNKEKISSEILLMAVGIVGNTEDIGLDKTKVKVDRGHIITNNLMQTSDNGVYAIGDVA